MIAEAAPNNLPISAQLYALCQAAYGLEAERIGCADFPPLRESLDELQRSTDRFLVYRSSGRIVGALSFDSDRDAVVITRLVIDPVHLRQGIATALLVELERRLPSTATLTVTTAEANAPAVLLYQRAGYIADRSSTSPEGIPLIQLSKSNLAGRCQGLKARAQ